MKKIELTEEKLNIVSNIIWEKINHTKVPSNEDQFKLQIIIPIIQEIEKLLNDSI